MTSVLKAPPADHQKEKPEKPRLLKRRKELNEIEALLRRIKQEAPPPGSNPLAFDKSDATVESAGYIERRFAR